MLRVVQDEAPRAELAGVLDEIVRDGARRMLAAALESEVDAYVAGAKEERDDAGRALAVRNGKARARRVVTGAGALEVQAPRINDRRTDEQGERIRCASEILPPYARRSPKVSQVLPLLYLHGLSTGDFRPALAGFFGSDAGLSPAAITRLTTAWEAERKEFMARKLKDRDYVYIWVDGVHFNVRLGDDGRLCCLVMVGVRLDGSKELIALQDGYRESTESWAGLLRTCKKRGMRAPMVAVGDGALGFLGRGERRLFRDASATGLGAQDSQCSRLPAEAGAAGLPSAPSSRSQALRARTPLSARLPRSPRSSGEVAEGGRKDRG